MRSYFADHSGLRLGLSFKQKVNQEILAAMHSRRLSHSEIRYDLLRTPSPATPHSFLMHPAGTSRSHVSSRPMSATPTSRSSFTFVEKPPPECSRFLNIGERQWIISYLADLSNFKSLSRFALSKINEAKETTRLRVEKEKVNLAVLVDLLFRFAKRHEDLHGDTISRLVKELLKFAYTSKDADVLESMYKDPEDDNRLYYLFSLTPIVCELQAIMERQDVLLARCKNEVDKTVKAERVMIQAQAELSSKMNAIQSREMDLTVEVRKNNELMLELEKMTQKCYELEIFRQRCEDLQSLNEDLSKDVKLIRKQRDDLSRLAQEQAEEVKALRDEVEIFQARVSQLNKFDHLRDTQRRFTSLLWATKISKQGATISGMTADIEKLKEEKENLQQRLQALETMNATANLAIKRRPSFKRAPSNLKMAPSSSSDHPPLSRATSFATRTKSNVGKM